MNDELRISNFPGKIRHISSRKLGELEVVLHNVNGFFQETLAKSFFDENMQSGTGRFKFQVLGLIQYT